MSRLIAALVAIVLILVAPAAVLSSLLSSGLQRDFHAEDAAVRVLAGPIGLVTGRPGRLRFRLRGATIEGVTVREFRADLRGARLEMTQAWRGQLRVREVSRGEMALVVDEDAMQRHLATVNGIREPRVVLDDGAVKVTGTVVVLNAPFGVEIQARLAIQDGAALVLQVEHLTVNGVAVPPDIGTILAAGVNPVLRAPRDPVPVRFDSVTVRDGQAVIVGAVIPSAVMP